MFSDDNPAGALTSIPPLKGRTKGVIASIIIHIGVLFLLSWTSVAKMIPEGQIIQVNLISQNISGSSAKIPRAANFSQSKPQQNMEKTTPLSEQLPVEERVIQKNITLRNQEEMSSFYSDEGTVAVIGQNAGNKDVSAGIKRSEDFNNNAIADEDKKRGGIAETEFGGINAPKFIRREMPDYPLAARRLGKEGRVLLRLLIDIDGNLQSVEVVESAGFGFAESAVAAVKRSTYAPATFNGEKISAKALLPVRFCLRKEE